MFEEQKLILTGAQGAGLSEQRETGQGRGWEQFMEELVCEAEEYKLYYIVAIEACEDF